MAPTRLELLDLIEARAPNGAALNRRRIAMDTKFPPHHLRAPNWYKFSASGTACSR
jgi:hypothetical protein